MPQPSSMTRRIVLGSSSPYRRELLSRLKLEFEVDSNRVGQHWNVKIFHDGRRILNGTRTTAGASGSFEVRKLAANHAGRDHFRATATRVGGTQTCTGRIAL